MGRTGAFIALDSLMQQSQHDTQLDVLRTTTSLRHDRCNMIQTQVSVMYSLQMVSLTVTFYQYGDLISATRVHIA